MTVKERKALMQVYQCLNSLSGQVPSNVADFGRHVTFARVSNQAIGQLMNAIFEIAYGNAEEGQETAELAFETILTGFGLKVNRAFDERLTVAPQVGEDAR